MEFKAEMEKSAECQAELKTEIEQIKSQQEKRETALKVQMRAELEQFKKQLFTITMNHADIQSRTEGQRSPSPKLHRDSGNSQGSQPKSPTYGPRLMDLSRSTTHESRLTENYGLNMNKSSESL